MKACNIAVLSLSRVVQCIRIVLDHSQVVFGTSEDNLAPSGEDLRNKENRKKLARTAACAQWLHCFFFFFFFFFFCFVVVVVVVVLVCCFFVVVVVVFCVVSFSKLQ